MRSCSAPSRLFGPPTYTRIIRQIHVATKCCLVIKLHEGKDFTRSTTSTALVKRLCNTNVDARSVCVSEPSWFVLGLACSVLYCQWLRILILLYFCLRYISSAISHVSLQDFNKRRLICIDFRFRRVSRAPAAVDKHERAWLGRGPLVQLAASRLHGEVGVQRDVTGVP